MPGGRYNASKGGRKTPTLHLPQFLPPFEALIKAAKGLGIRPTPTTDSVNRYRPRPDPNTGLEAHHGHGDLSGGSLGGRAPSGYVRPLTCCISVDLRWSIAAPLVVANESRPLATVILVTLAYFYETTAGLDN